MSVFFNYLVMQVLFHNCNLLVIFFLIFQFIRATPIHLLVRPRDLGMFTLITYSSTWKKLVSGQGL